MCEAEKRKSAASQTVQNITRIIRLIYTPLHTRMHRGASKSRKKSGEEKGLRAIVAEREKIWNSIVSLSKHEMQIELNFSFDSIRLREIFSFLLELRRLTS